MDTWTASKTEGTSVEEQVALIRQRMPGTYAAIQAQAQLIGKEAYALVRRSLRGEPNCFYAIERGYVVGAPFALPGINADVAVSMVRFGVSFVCIWPVIGQGGERGAN